MELKIDQKFQAKAGTITFVNGSMRKRVTDTIETIKSINHETIITYSGRIYHISDVENNIINEPQYVNIYGHILPAPIKHPDWCYGYYCLTFNYEHYLGVKIKLDVKNESKDETIKLIFNTKSELNEWLSFLNSIANCAYNSNSEYDM